MHGGPGWEWVPERQQFYYHTFLVSQPELTQHEQSAQGEQGDARGGAPAARSVRAPYSLRRLVLADGGQQQPADPVRHDADSAGRRGGDEGRAQQERVHAEPFGEAGAHAGHEPVFGIAP